MPKRILGLIILGLSIIVIFTNLRATLRADPKPVRIPLDATFKQIVLDVPPLVATGQAGSQIMVSAGDFLPLAGGSADWYQGRGVLRGSVNATVTAGSREATVNGVPRRLAAAPFLIEGKLYIPFSLALEVLGMSAGDAGNGTVGGGTADNTTAGNGAGSTGDASRTAGEVREGQTAELGADRVIVPGAASVIFPGRGGESWSGPAAPDLRLPPIQADSGFHFRYHPVYDLQASYDPAKGIIQGELLLAYQNPYLAPLRRLYFNLPANAPFGNGAATTVTRVVVNNRPVAVRQRQGQLEVPLPRVLAPRETLSLALTFKTTVPPGNNRLGRSGELSQVSGWYPILAPKEGDSWAGVAGTSYGDPYFASAAYYRVRLSLPTGYQVLASARLTGSQAKGEWTDWSFNSEQPVREFAFTAASDWRFTACQAGAVQLVAAARGEAAGAALEVARQALEFFQEVYGPYPYSYFHLAFVPLDNLMGMEYPGLILLSNRKPYSPAVVVHEVAHQWWYNLVGNDTHQAAWIDEGLAEYSTLLFYRRYDPGLYQAKLAEITRLAAGSSDPINLPLEEYGSDQTYHRAVYNRGATFWLSLEGAAGAEHLQQALAYIQRYYRYEIVPAPALLTVLTYYGKLNSNIFGPFLRNK
ncbi:M1 family aminopeptidase [Moorella naiadis]|uniref:M1 family aminopeptidase n=1 Tax=Moorella naiadis (nom. illeg.) TaxID=3093670 RepID=UPI003D9CB173